jgi:ABC-2 type transport system permease protein
MTSASLSLGDKFRNKKMYILRTLWGSLIALLFFAAYFILGVIMMVSRSINYAAIYHQSAEVLQREKLGAVAGIVGMHSGVWVLVMFTAIMFAIQGFSYVFSSSQIDFYLSQPTTRTQRIRKNYLNAHGTFLVIYVCCEAVALIVAAALGAVNGNVIMSALIETFRALILFFAFYNMTVLAVMLSGTLAIAILMTIGFTFVSIILSGEIMLFKSMFFATHSGSEPFKVLLSPLYDRFASLSDLLQDGDISSYLLSDNYISGCIKTIIPNEIDTLVVGVIAFIAVLVFSRFRKAEWAGTSIPLRPFRWFIKILVCVLVGLGSGFFVFELYESVWNSRLYVMMCVVMVLATVITGCIAEVILEGNIKRMFKGMAQTIMAIAIVVLVFVIYKGDLLGFDSFIPAADKVEDCAFINYNNSFSYYTGSFGGGSYGYNSEKYMSITNVEDFIDVAKVGMETQKEYTKQIQQGNYVDMGYQMSIVYRMKSGKEIYRQITIPYDGLEEQLDRLISSDEYKQGGFEIFHDDEVREMFARAENKTLRYSTPTESNDIRVFDYDAVSDAYRKDILENYRFLDIKEKMPIASLEVEINSDEYCYGNLEVYDTFTNTISLMRDYGIYSDSAVDLSDIKEIVVSNYYPGYDLNEIDVEDIEDVPDSQSYTYTDKADIQAILDASISTDYYNQWYNYNNNDSQYSIEVKRDGETYTGAYYSFVKGKVPGFVAEDTNK